MHLLDQLFAIRLHEKQSMGGYIIQSYLTSKDKFSLYSVSKIFQIKYAERCPICHTILDSKKKRYFQEQIRNIERHLHLPDAPCGDKKCNSKIFGYISRRPKYGLKMFFTKFNPKRVHAIDDNLKEALEDWGLYGKDYRKAFKSGRMYYTGSWG